MTRTEMESEILNHASSNAFEEIKSEIQKLKLDYLDQILLNVRKYAAVDGMTLKLSQLKFDESQNVVNITFSDSFTMDLR